MKLRQISSTASCLNASPSAASPTPGGSGNRNKKSGSSTGFKLFAFTLGSFAFGFTYIVLNPDVRRQVESAIPQSSSLFKFIDGFYTPSNSNKQPVDFPSKNKA